MIKTLRKAAIAAALLLAVGNAWALGLGQIQVKSRRNQPLLAEIPIVSTTPGELEALQARLASPETFRRVGLAPPSGIAADLQFSLGSDARGRPVIRVTTSRPVDQASLNFLIEVDWGQGRLVREYSALVDAPDAANAPLQPAIEAPALPEPNLVQRDEPALPPPDAAPAQPTAQPTPAPTQPAPQPVPPPVAEPPASVAATPVASAEYGPVKAGESLSKIASGLDVRAAYSLEQTMLALLRANPDAFLGDDINRLKRGAVLRLPTHADVAQVDAGEAAQIVRQQMRVWREARRVVRQPEAPVAQAAVAAAAPKPSAPPAAPPAKPAAAAATTAAPRSEARLQIVPPTAPGKATGTRSGTAAGGEGSMLQQQLQQKDEDIAAKSAEIGELKERVAELERLKDEQQKLLSMKDSELAAAQQRLAESNNKAATAQPADAGNDGGSMMPWLWGGIGLLVLALLAWLLGRRRKSGDAEPVRRSGFDSSALAASMLPPTREEATAEETASEPAASPPARPAPVTIDLADVPPAPPRIETPTWHSGWVKTDTAPTPKPATEAPTPRFVPLQDALPDVQAVAAPASAEERFKLARAFLDLGDEHTAKQLLLELLDDTDPAARTEAARLLRELG
ncbi:MAG: FimV/HubP family polar landmark protein [Thermomonas sp.]|uniref:type IV pilus assembly protein FimV n=1 Tax=Thermomonas sp. TaxID=1971895 RepID=UPI0039E6334E